MEKRSARSHIQVPSPNRFKTIATFLFRHLVDSTAILMAVVPIYTFIELVILRMNPAVSLSARLYVIGMTYLGTGILVAKGRDLSKRVFRLDQPDVVERKIVLHDLFYLVGFNAVFAPLIYFISRATSAELIRGTISAMAISFFSGPINGFFIDAVRDLTGIQSSQRLPQQIQTLNPAAKLAIFLVTLSLLIVIISTIYAGLLR